MLSKKTQILLFLYFQYVGGFEEKEIQEDEASVYSDSTAAQEAEEKRLAIAARRVLEETKKDTEETLEDWQQKANEVVMNSNFCFSSKICTRILENLQFFGCDFLDVHVLLNEY